MPDTIEAIYRILSTRPMPGEQRLPVPAEKLARLDQLIVGQQVQGKVLAIANGTATVLIGNQQVRMELPVKAAVGDTFHLIFAGQHPRPTFVLTESGQAAKMASQAGDAAQVPGRVLSIDENGEAVVLIGDRTVRMELPARAQVGDTFRLVFASPSPAMADADVAANVSTHISDAAHLLGAAMKMALDRKAPAQADSVVPLIGTRPDNPAALVLGLRLALARTGLFYESHLAEWSSGNYPIASLLREPQGRHSDPALLQLHAPPGPVAGQSANTDLLQLIAQQLQLLENHSLVWRGEVWPGQAMEWEITRQDSEHGKTGSSEASPAGWKTRISVEMPKLGKVVADLHLDSLGRLDVRLTGDDEAASRFEPGRQDAVNRLVAAGCKVNNFMVARNAHA